MTTKAELIAAMADAAQITRDQARRAFEAYTDTVISALKRGPNVRMVGFGAFVCVERKAGTARNPQTGEIIARAASRTARFRPGEGLKSALNG